MYAYIIIMTKHSINYGCGYVRWIHTVTKVLHLLVSPDRKCLACITAKQGNIHECDCEQRSGLRMILTTSWLV